MIPPVILLAKVMHANGLNNLHFTQQELMEFMTLNLGIMIEEDKTTHDYTLKVLPADEAQKIISEVEAKSLPPIPAQPSTPEEVKQLRDMES